MKGLVAAATRIIEGARIWSRAYNFGRRVLPGPARFWIRTVVLRQSRTVPDFETLLLPSTARLPAAPSPPLGNSTSVIIVTHNKIRLTALCLESLWDYTPPRNVEIIVVDNASHDGTAQIVRDMQRARSNLRLIGNAENRGFAAATNQGLMASSGEILVLLNNDTVVTRGWLAGLVRCLSGDRAVGMVGPVTNFSGNESRVEVSYASLEDMHAFADVYSRAHAGETRELPMLGMFCVALRRDVLQRVGLLDERFGIGMFEDDDYAWRVRALGYRLVCAEDVFVHHFGRSSIKDLEAAAYDALFERNKQLFERKWGTVWERHRFRGGVQGLSPSGR